MSNSVLKLLRAPALVLCLLALAPGTVKAQPTLAPATVVAGPSAAITGLGGMSIARDGTGGLVFTEQVDGIPHVFVSRLLGGAFQAPVQVDPGLTGASSQPVIAAGNGGLLLVAFVNSGALFVADAGSASSAFALPQLLAGGAASPAISISNFPKAYLAFTVGAGAGTGVRSAYWDAGSWSLEPTPLNVTAGDDAGAGMGRPAVAAAGDGLAIVAWGENGHVYARRVWGTAPSPVVQQADPSSVSGWREATADEPSVGTGGDSSYADIGFREQLTNGTETQDRVLMTRLVSGTQNGPVGADALGTPGVEGADDPDVIEGEYGRGFLLSSRETTNAVEAMAVGTNGTPGPTLQVTSDADAAVGGTAGLFSSVVAWQQTSVAGPSEVLMSYGTDGQSLGAGVPASEPGLGGTDAAAGIAAAGDVNGDAAAAWVQGTGESTRIVAAEMLQPPGTLAPSRRSADVRTSQPTFSWSASREAWGLAYEVTVDGRPVGSTTRTSLRMPAPLVDGAYTWQVTAVNRAGTSTAARTARVRVDTLAPIVTASLSGQRRVGKEVRLRVTVTDVRPGEPTSTSSGIASASVRWGDSTRARLSARPVWRHVVRHVYLRAGLYRVTIRVADRAGNTTTIVRHVRIRAPRAARRRPRHGPRAPQR